MGHTFDLSKEGYLNLLLANKKNKLNPGDNKLMVNAREAFLSLGHYDFIIKTIESQLEKIFAGTNKNSKPYHLLDMGCGSGYYIRELLEDVDFQRIGIDISKQAIVKAAKISKTAIYIVSSIFDLPIKDSSIDLALSIFSPISLNELERILKPGGILVKVIPGPEHMQEIAAMVYDEVMPHHSTIEADFESRANLEISKTLDVKQVLNLEGQALTDFISMTPYLYKFNKGALENLPSVTSTISFKVIFVKNSTAEA